MNNEQIALLLKKTAEMLELHGENPFKVKSYAAVAFSIDKMNVDLASLSEQELLQLEGLGKSMAKNVQEIIKSGTFSDYETLRAKTPDGVFEMLNIKGIGPKKVATLWHELGIENKEALKIACQENKVAQLKGFGEKTQETILKNLNFEGENQSKLRIDEAESMAIVLLEKLKTIFPKIEIVGATVRYMEIVEEIEFLAVGLADEKLINDLNQIIALENIADSSNPFKLTFNLEKLKVVIHLCKEPEFQSRKILLTSSEKHLLYNRDGFGSFFNHLINPKIHFKSETEVYESFGSSPIPPEIRETGKEWEYPWKEKVPTEKDIKGVGNLEPG
ncbi:MAG: helix-hairpin-helix domain-containing protein [Cytophagales bacterium]